ncbi:CehA/McbA family metallohydrolase [Actinopolymorpha sp. B17G11]|uniref:CehA/McbA family metallohydrolase n=1 Tax=Actinopolymorpha sp. B17G11 TaxID=3160861 RepID=UPI0032E3B184
MSFSANTDAVGGGDETVVLEGRFEIGAQDWVYLPVDVPEGVREIAVAYGYDRPEPPAGLPGNALDIGIFDERGHGVPDGPGFRGWSGGARDSFVIGRTQATPGYVPGPVNAGTWHILLGPYTVAPQGMTYRVEVTLRRDTPQSGRTESGRTESGRTDADFVPCPAPARAHGRGPSWYRGDLHMHTVHSDGQLEPAELAAAARDAGLDFIVSTEHNTCSAAGIWGHHASDDLLIIVGEEVTTRNGHLVAAGLTEGSWIDWRFRAADGLLPATVGEIHRQGGIAIAAHPFAPCLGCAWKYGFDDVDAIEVWNGDWTPDDEVSLRAWDAALVAAGRAGRWLPAVGSSDFHGGEDRVGLGQTVVRAEALTREAILAGVRAGHSYLTGSSEVEMEFSARGAGHVAGIGGRLCLPWDAPVTLDVAVRGGPEGFVRFVTDKGAVAQLETGGEGSATWTTTAAASHYVRVEVRRPHAAMTHFEPMVALTNPIFLDTGA